MTTPGNLSELIEKYQAGTATPEERNLLSQWYRSLADEGEIIIEGITEKQLEKALMRRLAKTTEEKSSGVSIRRNRWLAAAVFVGIVMISGIYIFLNKKSNTTATIETAVPVKKSNDEIVPGGNKAVLVLADGSTVVLDSAADGTLATQGNIKVEKLENGLLAYTINGKTVTENDEAFYNIISTPRGGQYQITLSDGTGVWLNAASSIRFPVVFKGNERRVEVTGETYLEVAPQYLKEGKRIPFIVNVAGKTEVEVLGTHFNINAYDDEAAIKTTLTEGKIKVTAQQESEYLLPGQQSGVKNGKIIVLKNVDVEEVMAWKNGWFQFNKADIKTMLRQVARWYDVEIEYRGNVDLHFTGGLSRSATVTKVFEKLELTGEVKFKTEGRKIIVSP